MTVKGCGKVRSVGRIECGEAFKYDDGKGRVGAEKHWHYEKPCKAYLVSCVYCLKNGRDWRPIIL
jgi:hypothetical protein